MMERPFIIRGVNPATGLAVELTLVALTELDARAQAQAAGLESVTAAPAKEANAPSAGRAAAAGDNAGTIPLVLVVDDYEETRLVLSRLLRADGYRAIAVSSAVEALKFLETTTPSLVITDLEMPGMDGLALFARIRKDPRHRALPVILFSAHEGEVRETALRDGVDAYIVKGSMDWAVLQREVVRLAGAGALAKSLPDVPRAREKNAG